MDSNEPDCPPAVRTERVRVCVCGGGFSEWIVCVAMGPECGRQAAVFSSRMRASRAVEYG